MGRTALGGVPGVHAAAVVHLGLSAALALRAAAQPPAARLSRPAHRGLLAVLAVPLIVYPTLFGENGAVSDTAWMFLYEYLLIAYLRRWPDNRLAHLLQHRAARSGSGWGCRFSTRFCALCSRHAA